MADWQPYDFTDKAHTAPPADRMVWVLEMDYEAGVTVGIFDGFTFRMLPSGTDDCDVRWWAPIEMPAAPPGAAPDAEPPPGWFRDDTGDLLHRKAGPFGWPGDGAQ
jgi:hypothetical protein